MKKSFLVIVALSIICIIAYTNHSDAYWAQAYGGSGNGFDDAVCIEGTLDGGYIVVGNTGSFGVLSNAIWVLKLNSIGNVTWQKTYDGNNIDLAKYIQQTSDGGYIIVGETYSFGAGANDIWVLKLNADGTVNWQKTYGIESPDHAYSIKQTDDDGDDEKDDGYIVVGSTYLNGSGGWILKLDSSGGVTWHSTYRKRSDVFQSIQQTADGGYIVAGTTLEGTGPETHDALWILKLDSTGVVSWDFKYSAIGGGNTKIGTIQQTADGGYAFAGSTSGVGSGGHDAWVVKLSSIGEITWQKAYGGTHRDEANDIKQTADGGYIVVGDTDSFGNDSNILLIRLDSNGNIVWQKMYNDNDYDSAQSVILDSLGYTLAGRTSYFQVNGSDFFIMKLNSNGEIPDCNIIDSTVVVTNTEATEQDILETVQSTDPPTITDTNIVPQDTLAERAVVCCHDVEDNDCDNVLNGDDNCPDTPNGPLLGTCTAGSSYTIARPCTGDSQCGLDGFCSMNQEDIDEDGIGDACDICESDFDCDMDCDAIDVTTFLEHFGRNQYNRECTNPDPCRGDYWCDGDVDADDVTKFLEDFGRNQYNNPCPACVPGDWCSY